MTADEWAAQLAESLPPLRDDEAAEVGTIAAALDARIAAADAEWNLLTDKGKVAS